ncbi:hypothetical protein KY309_00085 [Candidatus Woesearchaeota archaeon]|nr:hypothetical protein [Candidatus Woesearchaeota archaeon]MBW3015990.1 hypothetical protein [Candidatus Woesearchaeota archaeon]
MKKTLAGLVLAAAAAIFPSGCSKETEIQTQFQDRYLNPIAQMKYVKDDGSLAAFYVNNGTDIETFVFNSASNAFSNVSNDPDFTDYPAGFLGNDVVAISYSPDGSVQKLKIFTSNGVFVSDECEEFNDVVINSSNFMFEVENNNDQDVMTFNPATGLFEKVVPHSNESYIQAVSKDGSVALIKGYDSYSGYTVYMRKDGVLTPLINLSGHYGEAISDDNKKAYIRFSSGGEGIKVVDVDTQNIQTFNAPSTFDWTNVSKVSPDGLSAIVNAEENGFSNDRYYRLDTATGTWTYICDENNFFVADISGDGVLTVFQGGFYGSDVRLFNASTPEFYMPVSTTLYSNQSFLGFTSNNKALITGNDTSTWNLECILHDPATKTNTLLGDSVNYEIDYVAELSPNKEYVALNSREIATGYDAVQLVDLIGTQNHLIKQTGFDVRYTGMSPDNSRVYVQSIGMGASNLLSYDLQTQTFTQITNHADRRVDWFTILGQSNDGGILYFEEYHENGTKEILEYESASGLVTKISN